MKENKIMMPHGLTMLARGLTHMEGVLANIAPDINMVEIARARLAADFLHNFNFKKELKSTGRSLLKSVRKMIDIPSMTTDLMDEFMKGQTKVNLDLRVSKDLAFLLRRLVRNIVMGLWVMALLISSSIICTTDMHTNHSIRKIPTTVFYLFHNLVYRNKQPTDPRIIIKLESGV